MQYIPLRCVSRTAYNGHVYRTNRQGNARYKAARRNRPGTMRLRCFTRPDVTHHDIYGSHQQIERGERLVTYGLHELHEHPSESMNWRRHRSGCPNYRERWFPQSDTDAGEPMYQVFCLL